ncbi:hypothetical protein NEUTE1DRAFT_82620 [Neurospora tetrasperma FGSC 2508]|uniref:Uncharacterized protein n=1 Tax=Neurospora tetrasperma (strain FGSC 2508 / ATCC MYA-4615 / P0657) TaxID=510951 RepID=F8MKG1_NEUT8|nr:uncharacterized protein NEUTE1DRAFT_82620 [Neurospora tetrasperma FGSC 2508]EGO58242.1 hypothetical protein NEUTE1DRAFT_82620 [Neurospora tetrasperma FGSC 2508]EGZ71442.1 hypothetical protein NEUTE2DRAFT_109969 [Neurospora tetrasperma FGSC 2509]
MSSGSDRSLRRRFNQDSQPSSSFLPPAIPSSTSSAPTPPLLPSLRSLGSRLRPGMSAPGGQNGRPSRYSPFDRAMERHRTHMNPARERSYVTPGELQDSSSSSQPSLFGRNTPPEDMEELENFRRAKRRKLDSDKVSPSYKNILYGKYGQVEPGPLLLEIVSCDGGLFRDGRAYVAENILKDDASVYCTRTNRCNIILRHHGGTVFSLKELVIKAPGSHYSQPVREGMVFVSMEHDDLLKRTAQYQIQYEQPANPQPRTSRDTPTIYSVRHDDDGRIYPSRYRRDYISDLINTIDDDEDDDEDQAAAALPPEFSAASQPFNVTTECSDDESEGDENHLRRRRTLNRIGALPFESDSSDDGRDPWNPSGLDWTDLTRARPSASWRNEYDTATPELERAREASQVATQEAVRAVGGALMSPLAQFYIEKDKNKCIIKFDPPVSARYILLKMWSPHPDPLKNIDIQGVVAKGFAGPQLFPAQTLQ